jgi:poly(A) polymerase
MERAGTIPLCDILVSRGYAVKLRGSSAVDRYLGWEPLPFIWVETDADPSDLARLFEDLCFPGSRLADGSVGREGRQYFFLCVDPYVPEGERQSFTLLGFTQDWRTGRFQDPFGVYPYLRELRGLSCPRPLSPTLSRTLPRTLPRTPSGKAASVERFRRDIREQEAEFLWWEGLRPGTDYYRALGDAALILARYTRPASSPVFPFPVTELADRFHRLHEGPPPGETEQRLLLTGLLVSPRPDLGLELLKASGFIEKFWPELGLLDNVDHSKEFHPEGNVWSHTLETFRYRKPAGYGGYDFRLSLSLLLHDLGKPLAASSGSRRFDGHAELGARAARKFLERLGFEESLIADIFYLVKNHMLPAALPQLPLARTGEILESPLFPSLLELYRCDESSSFKGLEGYYKSSAAYQSYLRYRRNPYRSADGRKKGRSAGSHGR